MAAVEFAVVLPLFVLLLMGTIDAGRAIDVQQQLIDAARASCRLYTVANELDEQDALAVVETIMSQGGFQDYTVTLDPSSSDQIQHGEPVTVSVSIPYDQASWLPSWFLSGRTLTGTCIMPGDTGEVAADHGGGDAGSGDDDDDDEDDDDDDDDDDDGNGWGGGWGGGGGGGGGWGWGNWGRGNH